MKFLKKCSNAYYNSDEFHTVDEEDAIELKKYGFDITIGTPVTDEMFDKIQKEVAKTDKEAMTVGSPIRGAKIDLPVIMGSMDELHEGELINWIKPIDYVVSTKLDGCSCLVHYTNGQLDKAFSRGDGRQGQDITKMIMDMVSVPKTLTSDFTGYIRGELILKKSQFLELTTRYKEEMGKIYKNARNLVAGKVNSIDTDPLFSEYGHLVCYFIDDFEGTEDEMFQKLKGLGIETAEHWVLNGQTFTEEGLTNLILMLKQQYDYEIDGVILTQNIVQAGYEGFEANGLNPKKSRKYKVGAKDLPAETTVKNIIWQISKSYALNPVIYFDTVHLDGVDINFASGHSLSQMESLGVGVGAKVVVSRHGMVIPEVDSVITPVKLEYEGDFPVIWVECIDEMNEKSYVKAQVSIRENIVKDANGNPKKNKMVYYIGNDPRVLREVQIQKLVYFATTMGIEYMGEGNCRMLVNAYPMLNVQTLLKLDENAFVTVIGANGSKIFKSIGEKISSATAPLFYSAVDAVGEASGIGEKKLQALWETYHTFDLTKEQIVSVSGWADKSADKLLEHAEDLKMWNSYIIENGIKFKDTTVEVKSNSCASLAVCFTGVRDKQMEQYIVENGGKIVSGVSKKCTLLITMDSSVQSTKLKKAQELGIQIMSYNEALDLYK